MPESTMPAADPFAEPDELAQQTVKHLKRKYRLPDDPEAASEARVDAELVRTLTADKVFHRYLRTFADRDPIFTAFLTRLRHALFFAEWTEDDREETPVGLMVSVVRQCMRLGYALPEDEEEASWVKLLAKELSRVDWRNPDMDRQLQLLRLALYRPLKGLPFETSLMLVRPDHWHEQIGALVDDALRSQSMGA